MASRDDLASLDATGQAALVRAGEVTAAELVEHAIARIEALDPLLNAVVTPMFDAGLAASADGLPTGPFTGVPFLVKDLAAEVAGTRFTEGSRFLAGNVSTRDQELVRRHRRAGLVIIGKTNTCEFGLRPICEPALFGATRNPWNPERTTGGSSGGSAAAVASGMVPIAHANDLGGSIRFPASCCGLFGLKPTRARNPLGPEYGDVVNGMAVEHALTRSVRDSAALLDATSGPAVGDPYWAPPPARPFAEEVTTEPGRLRVAFSDVTPEGRPVDPECVAALHATAKLCEQLGHDVVEATPPGLDTPEFGEAIVGMYSGATQWIIGYWARRVGREPGPDDIEPFTRGLWELSRGLSAGDYLLGVEHLQRVTRDLARFLETYDVWLTPTTSSRALRIGELDAPPTDPFATAEVSANFVAFPAVVANVSGHPAMSVPLYWSGDGLPIGAHFLGRFGDEATLFRLAGQLERAQPWADRRPPVFAGA